jgi:hypothetical protein
MAQIAWVKCIECSYKFYCEVKAFQDLKHKLLCPRCGKMFFLNEAPEVKGNVSSGVER